VTVRGALRLALALRLPGPSDLIDLDRDCQGFHAAAMARAAHGRGGQRRRAGDFGAGPFCFQKEDTNLVLASSTAPNGERHVRSDQDTVCETWRPHEGESPQDTR
jgi:hypothetical protein